MSLKTTLFGLQFCRRKCPCIFDHFHAIRPESYQIRWNYAAVRPITPFKVIQGHRVWYQSKAQCDFLLVINSNLPPIFHRFWDIALERSKIATFFFGLTLRRRGSPGTISVKFLPKVQMAKVPNGVETLPKISIAWVGCTNVTDDRQTTDGRTTTYSERERKFTFAKNGSFFTCIMVWSIDTTQQCDFTVDKHVNL